MAGRLRRESWPERVGGIVEREFGRMAGGRPLPASVVTAWRRVVGDRVARRALPVALRRDTLHVRVATSAWLTELQMLAPEILEKLGREAGGGRLRRLRLEVGPVPESRERAPTSHPEGGEETSARSWPPAVAEALAALRDPALRERIERTLSGALEGRSGGGLRPSSRPR